MILVFTIQWGSYYAHTHSYTNTCTQHIYTFLQIYTYSTNVCTHTYTTQTGEPNPPTHLTILLNNTVITLSWDPPNINSGCIVKFMVYISSETDVYTVFTPTLEILISCHCIYDTHYFNVVSVVNIERSGYHSDNSALLSISIIC